jgi:uncharacterized glyoxalase superfamily protein PhnB
MAIAGSKARVPADEVRAHTLNPYLGVDDARRAIEWYEQVFDARRRGEPYVMDDGRIGHAELAIGDSVLMLADEFPEIGLLGPTSRGGTTVGIHIQVPDVDAVVERARDLDATGIGDIRDNPYGRTCRLDDPFGHRWILLTPPAGQPLPGAEPPQPRAGDIAYVTIATPSDEQAKEFYGAVLGWTFSAGSVENGWQVDNVAPMIGIAGRREGDVMPCFRTDDMESALARVREFGGEAERPETMPYGRLASCVDNQGRRFQLWTPPER